MKIFATCLHALDSLMMYELLASNINAHCVHILLATRVHSTCGAYEEFVSLSTIVLNSKDWSEIVWLPEISHFKINLAISFIRKNLLECIG